MLQFFVNLTPIIITVTLNNAISKHKFAFSLNAPVSTIIFPALEERGRYRGRRKEKGWHVCLLNTVENKKREGKGKRRVDKKGRTTLFFLNPQLILSARPVDACRRREFREIEALLLN